MAAMGALKDLPNRPLREQQVGIPIQGWCLIRDVALSDCVLARAKAQSKSDRQYGSNVFDDSSDAEKRFEPYLW